MGGNGNDDIDAQPSKPQPEKRTEVEDLPAGDPKGNGQ